MAKDLKSSHNQNRLKFRKFLDFSVRILHEEGMDITNEQWERLAPLLSETPKGPRGQGRPVRNEPRAILNGILWILRTGAPWKDLPERYPPYQTCHRWFQRWRKEGVFDAILLTLADDLRERGKLDLREAFLYWGKDF